MVHHQFPFFPSILTFSFFCQTEFSLLSQCPNPPDFFFSLNLFPFLCSSISESGPEEGKKGKPLYESLSSHNFVFSFRILSLPNLYSLQNVSLGLSPFSLSSPFSVLSFPKSRALKMFCFSRLSLSLSSLSSLQQQLHNTKDKRWGTNSNRGERGKGKKRKRSEKERNRQRGN